MVHKELPVIHSHMHRRRHGFGGTLQAGGRDHSSLPPVVRMHHHGRSNRIRDPGCLQVGVSPDGEMMVGGRVRAVEEARAGGGFQSGGALLDWKRNLRVLVLRRSRLSRRLPSRLLLLRRTRCFPYLVVLRRRNLLRNTQ